MQIKYTFSKSILSTIASKPEKFENEKGGEGGGEFHLTDERTEIISSADKIGEVMFSIDFFCPKYIFKTVIPGYKFKGESINFIYCVKNPNAPGGGLLLPSALLKFLSLRNISET